MPYKIKANSLLGFYEKFQAKEMNGRPMYGEHSEARYWSPPKEFLIVTPEQMNIFQGDQAIEVSVTEKGDITGNMTGNTIDTKLKYRITKHDDLHLLCTLLTT